MFLAVRPNKAHQVEKETNTSVSKYGCILVMHLSSGL